MQVPHWRLEQVKRNNQSWDSVERDQKFIRPGEVHNELAHHISAVSLQINKSFRSIPWAICPEMPGPQTFDGRRDEHAHFYFPHANFLFLNETSCRAFVDIELYLDLI